VVPYDVRWADLFTAAAQELTGAFGPAILAVHHVGSTAIPGLMAGKSEFVTRVLRS